MGTACLNYVSQNLRAKEKAPDAVYDVLEKGKPEKLEEIFRSVFSGIPHDWYRKNEIQNYEGFYASIFYCYFTALGLDVCVEEATNHGRLDMAVIFEGS
jgi:hypothetical protein